MSGMAAARAVNFVHREIISSLAKGITKNNHPQFLHVQLWTWKNFRPGAPLFEINNIVDD